MFWWTIPVIVVCGISTLAASRSKPWPLHGGVLMSATASQIIGVSNVQLNRVFSRRSKKTSKLRVSGLCEGKSPVTDEFPAGKYFHFMTPSCGFWCFSSLRYHVISNHAIDGLVHNYSNGVTAVLHWALEIICSTKLPGKRLKLPVQSKRWNII